MRMSWKEDNIEATLRSLGPALCIAAGSKRVLEFAISPEGLFGSCREEDFVISARLQGVFLDNEDTGVTVQTIGYEDFTGWPRWGPCQSVLNRVKELRAYLVSVKKMDKIKLLNYEKVPPDELKQNYVRDMPKQNYCVFV